MARNAKVSPYGVLALLIGAVLSTATTCGPPDPVPDGWWADSGGWWYDTGGTTTEPDIGFTVVESGTFQLRGEGDTHTVTVRTTLRERCLREVADYAWGYPTGWLVLGYEIAAIEGDTAAFTGGEDSGTPAPPSDTGAVDTDTGTSDADSGTSDVDTGTTSDTGTSDTATSDTAVWTFDTAVSDTATSDTATSDTGAPDTADTDTGAPVDTSGDDTSSDDTGVPPDTGAEGVDGRVHVTIATPDGTLLEDVGVRLYGTGVERDSVTDERPYVYCEPDGICELEFTMTFTLAVGEAVDGVADAHARINMCSSGEPMASDLSVVVE